MSLKKNNIFAIIFFVIIILVISTIVIFPRVVNNIMTGFASFASLSVSLIVSPNTSQITNPLQVEEPGKNTSVAFFSARTQSKGGGVAINYVEADLITINASGAGVFQEYFVLHNPESLKKDFIINSTNNFIQNLIGAVTLEPNESRSITVLIDTAGLQPGLYTDYIMVTSGNNTQKITLTLNVFEQQQEQPEAKPPVEEKPAPVPEQVQKQAAKKNIPFLSIMIILACVVVITGAISLAHGKKNKKGTDATKGSIAKRPVKAPVKDQKSEWTESDLWKEDNPDKVHDAITDSKKNKKDNVNWTEDPASKEDRQQ
jgi:hypothetical protein